MKEAVKAKPVMVNRIRSYFSRMTIAVAVPLMTLYGCTSPTREPVTWRTIEKSLQAQLITLNDNDTLDLPEGNFRFTKSLTMDGKSNILIRGKGIGRTVLSFLNQSEGAQGILISQGKNIVLEDFSVEDAKGDNIKVTDTHGITFRRIASSWSGEPRNENGAYALYPVLCRRVLIEECLAIGSSDAGIYVGQSDSVIIRNSKAYWNVAGIESENSRWVEIYGNEAYENTGGILIFDLPGLTQNGHTTSVHHNLVHDNNHSNFATPGNVVASISPGTGLLILATHDLEMMENKIVNNTTLGIGIISYELVAAVNAPTEEQKSAGVQGVNNSYKQDSLFNPYPYRINIHDNLLTNRHWFPSMAQELGKLFLRESFMHPPDIVFDGIANPQNKDPEICLHNNGEIVFLNLDAAHEFRDLNKDGHKMDCTGVTISP
jgi:parallel beta-helix repeat protein